MSRLLIRNARLVNEGQVFDADLLIANGRIEKIATSIQGDNEPVEIDANGQWLLPGMIDDQVHFREPGAPEKGSFYSESRAAVAGGITSFMDMPNTSPATLNLEALADTGAEGVGVDWSVTLEEARRRTGNRVALQGNLDPAVLFASPERIRAEAAAVLQSYGPGPGHVFNLGHGITPDVKPDHLKALVDAVHELSRSNT